MCIHALTSYFIVSNRLTLCITLSVLLEIIWHTVHKKKFPTQLVSLGHVLTQKKMTPSF